MQTQGYRTLKGLSGLLMCAAWIIAAPREAGAQGTCSNLPTHAQLQAALNAAVAAETSGLDLQMWATIVDRDGIVCAVAFSGADRGARWPGSRVISAQKAKTANSRRAGPRSTDSQ